VGLARHRGVGPRHRSATPGLSPAWEGDASVSVEAAVEQLTFALTWWRDLLVARGLAVPAGDPRSVAVQLIADLTDDNRRRRRDALEMVQNVCVGYGDPIVHLAVPTDWWATPLGQLTQRVHHPDATD